MSSASQPDVQRALLRGVAALEASQLADGSFALLPVRPTPQSTPPDNLFATAIVLGVAAPHLSTDVVSRAAVYLLQRREPSGLWSWSADGALPPDADDTACCLGALALAHRAVGADEGAELLRRFWRFGGPFRTWLAGGAWGRRERDDAVVNCNVLWAFQRMGVKPRSRELASVERIVRRTRTAPWYYCSSASVAWAATRVGISTPQLAPPPLGELSGRALETALWSLSSFGTSAMRTKLMDMQHDDGGWAAEPWLRGLDGVYESRAVTIAFAIAAVAQSSL